MVVLPSTVDDSVIYMWTHLLMHSSQGSPLQVYYSVELGRQNQL